MRCESRSSTNPGIDLRDLFEGIYNDLTLRPGLSIGNGGIDVAGSFTGFFQHENNICGFTPRHVLLPRSKYSDPQPYKYKDGKDKLMVAMPAPKDHKMTKHSIASAISDFQRMIKDEEGKMKKNRATGWKVCIFNGIESIVKIENREPSPEHIFVGKNRGEGIFVEGDSGALVCDIEIVPCDNDIGNEAALVPIAMIWGGRKEHELCKDVTYATPIKVVLRDIEHYMRWEEGSLHFC
ncbi:hypothetical protein NHQ30_006460 [Ciborinia camelliae]|nr:hypothetical protein NHQ30_006460 [Ciborinia camelliae]